MPICEADPWRVQYFVDANCPPDVNIPTEDGDAYLWYPRYKWVYNKLAVAESQDLACAPHGIDHPAWLYAYDAGAAGFPDAPGLTSAATMSVRGNFSSNFLKSSFSVTLVDDHGRNNPQPLGGLEAHEDWALVGPWLTDRSYIIYSGKVLMEGRKEDMKPMAFSEREVELGRSDVARRAELAEWIVGAENPWFAKAFVNRIWARLMSRGFCEPVDEIGELGDRVLPEIHNALADHFVASQFNVKDVFRVVALSHSYQREIHDPEKSTSQPFAVIPAGRLRGDEVFDSLEAAIEIPLVSGESV